MNDAKQIKAERFAWEIFHDYYLTSKEDFRRAVAEVSGDLSDETHELVWRVYSNLYNQ
jgi:hypothetical protein